MTEQRGDRKPAPAPRDPAEPVRWFDETSERLLKVLDTDPAASTWTFHPPHRVGFRQRRRALEALVHRWGRRAHAGEDATARLDRQAGLALLAGTSTP